ncbi:MAG: hypothetical protein F7C09_00590 [Aeropyrum sp.]|nr:hypothetical protein [Aeropyrum sp.]
MEIEWLAYAGIVAIGWLSSIGGYIEFKKSLAGGGFVCRADQKSMINCKSVYVIPQAFLLGRYHLSAVAPVFFTAVLAPAVVGLLTGIEQLLLGSLIVLAMGALTVPYLVYLELRIARAICLWCTVMHASMILGSIIGLLAALGS